VTTAAVGAAADALRAGSAVVLPNPHPLTSVVAATAPDVVNTAKGRPADQAVALWLADDDHWADFARILDLDPGTRALARDLLVREHLTLLLPLADVPDWVGPAARDGHALVFGACWAPLRPVLTAAGRLHVSSANRTGHPPVSSAARAREVFPPEVHVLDLSDGLPAADRRATTTLRVGRGGTLAHTRSGAQDHAHGGPEAYLAHLRRSFVD
jgi:tRNA A37 threonylcarbamoyladenosine synthetase subunit TsaC/SUA5/YrdC